MLSAGRGGRGGRQPLQTPGASWGPWLAEGLRRNRGAGSKKKKKPKNLSQRTGASPGLRLCRRGDRFTRHHGCQGARRAGLSGARRRRPRPRAASGRPSPRLSPRAAPPAAPGSASPATTAGPGGDGGAPGGGRPGMGWRAPRPPHARDGRVAPILLSRLPVGPPSPSPPRGSWRCPVTCRGRRRDAAWEM